VKAMENEIAILCFGLVSAKVARGQPASLGKAALDSVCCILESSPGERLF
jgi:hypothetical protein